MLVLVCLGKKIAQRGCGTNAIDSGNMTLLLTAPPSQKLKAIKWNKDIFKLQKEGLFHAMCS